MSTANIAPAQKMVLIVPVIIPAKSKFICYPLYILSIIQCKFISFICSSAMI